MTTIDELLGLLQNQVTTLLKQKANATEMGDILAIKDFENKISEVEKIIAKLKA